MARERYNGYLLMSYIYLVIPVFLLIVPLTQTNFFVYATNETIIPVGATDAITCPVLKGEIINQTVGNQTTSFCKFESRFLSYFPNTGGVTMPAESPWVDLHTGIKYTFPVVAISPIYKNATGTYYIGDRLFNIFVRSTGQIAGNDLILVPEQSKLEIISWGNDGNNSLTVSLPNELLSGEIRVMVDGNNTDYHIERTGAMTTIATKLDFSGGKQESPNPNPGIDPYLGFKWKKVEIAGTHMIPEFPYSFLILVIGIIGVLSIKADSFICKVKGRRKLGMPSIRIK